MDAMWNGHLFVLWKKFSLPLQPQTTLACFIHHFVNTPNATDLYTLGQPGKSHRQSSWLLLKYANSSSDLVPPSLSLCTWPPFWGFDNYEWQEVGNGLNNDAEVDYYFWLLYHIWNHLGRPFLFLFLLCSDPSPHVTWQCDYIDIVSYSLMHPRLHGSWCLSKLLNQQSRRTVSDVCFLFLCEGILISCLKWWC